MKKFRALVTNCPEEMTPFDLKSEGYNGKTVYTVARSLEVAQRKLEGFAKKVGIFYDIHALPLAENNLTEEYVMV